MCPDKIVRFFVVIVRGRTPGRVERVTRLDRLDRLDRLGCRILRV